MSEESEQTTGIYIKKYKRKDGTVGTYEAKYKLKGGKIGRPVLKSTLAKNELISLKHLDEEEYEMIMATIEEIRRTREEMKDIPDN